MRSFPRVHLAHFNIMKIDKVQRYIFCHAFCSWLCKQAAAQHRAALQTGLNVVHRVLAAQPREFILDTANGGETAPQVQLPIVSCKGWRPYFMLHTSY